MKRTKQKLIGIDEIAAYVETGVFNIMTWRREYAFPMHRDESGVIWCSTKSEVKSWMNDHEYLFEG